MEHPFEQYRKNMVPVPSQSELARRIGIRPPTYSAIIHGRERPGQRVLRRAHTISDGMIDVVAALLWTPPRRRARRRKSA